MKYDAYSHKLNYTKDLKNSCYILRYFNRFKYWSDTWLLELNISKCKVVSYSMKDRTDTLYSISHNGETYALDGYTKKYRATGLYRAVQGPQV